MPYAVSKIALGFMLCAASIAARAEALSLDAPAFSLTYLIDETWNSNGGMTPPSAYSVLSSSQSATQIRLDSMEQTMYGFSHARSHGASDYLQLGLQAKDGYRITGISFSASYTGTLQPYVPYPGFPVDQLGETTTNTAITAELLAKGAAPLTGVADERYEFKRTDITDEVSVDFALNNIKQRQAFDLLLYTATITDAFATYWNCGSPDDPSDCKMYGYSDLIMHNPVLTIHTEIMPVPEPAQYGMFAVGLAGVAWAGRRRRMS
jgi:PEP-CTERM motif